MKAEATPRSPRERAREVKTAKQQSPKAPLANSKISQVDLRKSVVKKQFNTFDKRAAHHVDSLEDHSSVVTHTYIPVVELGDQESIYHHQSIGPHIVSNEAYISSNGGQKQDKSRGSSKNSKKS